MIFYVFSNTTDVFKAEEMLRNNGYMCDIVPTPVQDKAYCGICIKAQVSQPRIEEILIGIKYFVYSKEEND